MPTRPPTLAEQVELQSKWDKGEHATLRASLLYHHRVHGAGMDFWEYLRRAAAFDRSTAKRNPPTGTRPDGTVKYKQKSGEFLIEKQGKIHSYGT